MSEPRPRKTHELRCWPEFFQPTLNAHKRFELRRDDRGGFQVGDQLLLREWDHLKYLELLSPAPFSETEVDRQKRIIEAEKGAYTGREVLVRVDYIMDTMTLDRLIRPDGINQMSGFVIMSISRVE
jgi:hypothetical protein